MCSNGRPIRPAALAASWRASAAPVSVGGAGSAFEVAGEVLDPGEQTEGVEVAQLVAVESAELAGNTGEP